MRSHIDTDPDFGVIPVAFVAIRSSDSEDLGEFTGNMVEANPGRTSSIIQRLCNVHIDEIRPAPSNQFYPCCITVYDVNEVYLRS